MDNKSFRRCSHVGEGIAGYECQPWIRCPVEDLNVSWINDLDCIYDISKCPVGSRQQDPILRPHVTQGPKEGVPMGGDADIPAGPWQRSTFNVAGGHSKNFRTRAFKNHHRNVEARNLDSSNRLSRARRSYDEGMPRSGVVRFRIALPLVIEELTRLALHANHVQP